MKTIEIIEKIKKLLRMKRGGTPEEVATALRMAQELAARHGVNLDDVNPDDDVPKSERIGHEDPIASARIQCECKYAGLVCEQFFNVEVFTTAVDVRVRGGRMIFRRALRFVGTEWDRQVAIYVFHFLVRHFRHEWRTKRGRLRNRESFLWGMYCGLCAKLRERQPTATESAGLVHAGRRLARRSYIEENFVLDGLEAGEIPRIEQDERLATWEPALRCSRLAVNSGRFGAGVPS